MPGAPSGVMLHWNPATSTTAVARLASMVAAASEWKENTMVASRLRDIVFDCDDQRRVARFWAEVLGYSLHPEQPDATPDDPVVIVASHGGVRIWFNKVPEPKITKNRVHIDIDMPDTVEMDRLLRLGACVLRRVHAHDGKRAWTIMADPEGNAFCSVPPGG